jgi:hypothetical protein
MALSRDSRMDRRRRVLLDASSAQQAENASARRPATTATPGEPGTKKSAGYSQDVRQACGTRLVQLIPVRRRSFIALIATSIMITSSLLLVHYLVYVNGRLPWFGHPLAITVDLTHPQSIASWLGGHLWLLCLGTTILTFQLRRHKLDDYSGEYRLWFWLVITCVLANLDSTTHISELFGAGLDKWTRANIGWSGKAVVLATMSTLVGMLGLRLCSELKSVPLSLVCWLIGLVAWAGSAALSQEKFLADLAVQTRFWLRASLWLGGLTSIWIAAVAYLRYVYMDAQRRFLARGRLARRVVGIPLGERVRQSIPFIGRKKGLTSVDSDSDSEATEAARWSLRRVFGRRTKPTEEVAPPTRRVKQVQPVASGQPTTPGQASNLSQEPAPPLRTQPSAGPLSAANRSAAPSSPSNNSAPATLATTASTPASKPSDKAGTAAANSKSRWPFGFKLWPGKHLPEEEAIEYRKIRDEEREQRANERKLQREAAAAEKAAAKHAKQSERESAKLAKSNTQGEAKPKKEKTGRGIGKKLLAPLAAVRGVFKKIKLPSLAAFKLNPPEGEGGTGSASSQGSTLKPVAQDKALPGTNRPGSSPIPSTNQQRSSSQDNHDYDDEDADDDRQLSKADRKKLRRQNRAA